MMKKNVIAVLMLVLMSCGNPHDGLVSGNIKIKFLNSENVIVYYFKTYSFIGSLDYNSLEKFPRNDSSFGDCKECYVIRWVTLDSFIQRQKVLDILNLLNKYDNHARLENLINLVDNESQNLFVSAYIVNNSNEKDPFYKYIFILDKRNKRIYELDYDERS